MWEFGFRYKIWYLTVMDIEKSCVLMAKDCEDAMDIFQSFPLHKGLQIMSCELERETV